MIPNTLTYYVGAAEDVYAKISDFTVDGQDADATTYTASLALVGSDDTVMAADWQAASWVAGSSVPTATAFFSFTEEFDGFLYVLLAGPTIAPREELPMKVCRVRVNETP